MAAQPAAGSPETERDQIADARALVAMAISLGQRTRNAHRLGQVTDRKASLYVNTLVRHASRLLQSATSHNIPVLRAGSNGPGGNSVHYVVRHDRLTGPPAANRFLTVGSDARLRCCVVADHGGARIWADYDVTSAPEDLTLRVVLDSLSGIIARLEQTVVQLETRELVREAQLEADIATAKARIAGLAVDAPSQGRRQTTSEEPIRPWTRHLQTPSVSQPVSPDAEPEARAEASPETVGDAGAITAAAQAEARVERSTGEERVERSTGEESVERSTGEESVERVAERTAVPEVRVERVEQRVEDSLDIIFAPLDTDVDSAESELSADPIASTESDAAAADTNGHSGGERRASAARGFRLSRLHKTI